VRQGLSGDDITVYGSGEQLRCFADVADVVDCMLRLVERDETRGEVFNIGSDSEISIKQLAELGRERTGGGARIVYVPYDEAYATGFEDLQRRIPDLTKLEAAIGVRPRTPVEAIIDRVIAHMREHGER
jgi:UDP-glucose 4-epimerase